MQAHKGFVLMAASAILLFFCCRSAIADLVYKADEWPTINLPIVNGTGAPTVAADAAFTAQIAFTPTANLPGERLQSENPNSGGVCPTAGSFGPTGSCWWTCGFGSDGYPCAGPNDKRICKPGKWGLSYDDGPLPTTEKLLDSLKKNNLKATFCMIGSNVVRYPATVKRMQTEGHDLCIHTWSHSPLTTLTNDQIIAELKWTEKAIQAATGVKPLYFRPPYGDIDNRVRAIVEKMGYKVLLWLFDNNDYQAFPPSPAISVTTVTNNMKTGVANSGFFPNGLIALSHPERGSDTGVELAEQFFTLTKAGNISLVAVSECLGDSVPSLSSSSSTSSGTLVTSKTASVTKATTAASSATVAGTGSSYLWGLLAYTVVAVGLRTVWPVFKEEKQD